MIITCLDYNLSSYYSALLVAIHSTSHILDYLVHDTKGDGVDKANSSHSHQTQQEEVGIAVQLEVGGFWIKDGSHQLAFGCAET